MTHAPLSVIHLINDLQRNGAHNKNIEEAEEDFIKCHFHKNKESIALTPSLQIWRQN